MPRRKVKLGQFLKSNAATGCKKTDVRENETRSYSVPFKSKSFNSPEDCTSDVSITGSHHEEMIEFSPPGLDWQYDVCNLIGYDRDVVPVSYVGIENSTIGNHFIIHDVIGDGNCLFRALAFLVTGDEDNHLALRRELVAYMRKYKDRAMHHISNTPGSRSRGLSQGFEIQMANMEKSGTWGTQAEVISAASMLQTDIRMYQYTPTRDGLVGQWHTYRAEMLLRIRSVERTECLYLNHSNNHYNAVVGACRMNSSLLDTDDNIQSVKKRRKVCNIDMESKGNTIEHSSATQNDRNEKQFIKNMNECSVCGKTFKLLKLHLSKNTRCRENQKIDSVKNEIENQKRTVKIQLKQRKYNAANKETIREKQATYDSEHKTQIRGKQAKYNSTHALKINEKKKVYDRKMRDSTTGTKRINSFRNDVRYGPVFPCSSCHRMLYSTSVKRVTDAYKKRVNDNAMFYDRITTEIKAFNDNVYLCHTCYGKLAQGNCPPMSVQNGLAIDDIPPELQLSELESVLVAKNILFFKLFKLPKTRWSAMRDKVINIPINDNDLLKTLSELNSLPRGPDNAGLLPVKLKRKVEFKNFVLEAYIDPYKLVRAVELLKELGHPGYTDVSINDRFEEQMKSTIENINMDENCLHKADNNNDDSRNFTDDPSPTFSVMNDIVNIDGSFQEGEGLDGENFDDEIEEDNISRYQCKGNMTYLMDNDCPEISLIEQSSRQPLDQCRNGTETGSYSIAPGEGKIPSNLMRDKEWDINAFPHLYPTGKFGLNYDRAVKLSPWKYFTQRLYNVNRTFSSSTSYLFSALYYLERHQLEQQINVSYLRGNIMNGVLQEMNDPLSVLDPVPNSPRYCQKKRFEMMAKLESLGPFTFFWTLSCGELRWMENFTSILALDGCTISYETHDGHEMTYVDGKPLEVVLQERSLHELVRENVITMTRNFNQRVRAMVKNILLGKNNPMYSTFYNYRVEFQLRGAAHVHGVLWVDYNKLEISYPGLTDSMAKLRDQERLTDIQCDVLTLFIDTFTSCSLTDERVSDKVRDVQIHKHTKTCRKKGSECRFGFPRYPSERTIIAQPLLKDLYKSDDEYKAALKYHKEVLMSVKTVLSELKEEEYDSTPLERVLRDAGVSHDDYYRALSTSSRGTVIVLKRAVSEMYVNNYCPEWLEAWDANMDIQICLDYFGVITYITDYYTKDESGTMPFLTEALKECVGKQSKQKLRIIADTFLTHRMKGICEALYCMDPNLHLTDSNIKTVWADTNFPSKRRKFLRKVCDDDTDEDDDFQSDDNGDTSEYTARNLDTENIKYKTVRIQGKEGRYVQNSTSKHEKYSSRPDVLSDMSLAQFVSMYDSCPKSANCVKEFIEGADERSEYVVVTGSDEVAQDKIYLPKVIRVCEGSSYMRIRNTASVLRHKKYREDTEPHAFIYSELLLYHPWRDEEELFCDDFDKCMDLYVKNRCLIEIVKNTLYPHKNNVEQGRAFVESVDDIHASHVGDMLDPENEQAREDEANIGVESDEEYSLRNPDFINVDEKNVCNDDIGTSIYRRIDISDADEMRRDVQSLDEIQREIFDEILRYCRQIRKLSQDELTKIDAPLVVVHGGAGSGKSTLIKILAKWVEATLRTDDDRNPDQPHVIITAPTGTAAKNINGLTIHSAFNMPFGNAFISLSDQARDNKRNELANLRIMIVDEFSMVKADMLYQLNLRLKEIKQNDKDFGGVAVVFFGDIMQLRPVQAKYIFQKPKDDKFASSFSVRSIWEQFKVFELQENHRQDDDGDYADVLNRVRFGKQTENDIKILKSRNTSSPPENAIHLFGTNAEVNAFNEKRLRDLNGEVIQLNATNIHPTIKSYEPLISKDGSVHDSPLLDILNVKETARVMITYNVDLSDGIVNGILGTVRGFKRRGSDNLVHEILVEFDDPGTGMKTRQCAQRSDNLTPISRISFEYMVGKKSVQNSTKAKVIQFPMKLAWAVTVHKFQGQTIRKPTNLVGHMENINQSAQAYVLLGRVQSISQLFLTSFAASKIKVNELALDEANRLKSVAVNLQSPTAWKDDKPGHLKISQLNIKSLNKHIDDLKSDQTIMQSDVICLTETWMTDDLAHNSKFSLPGFRLLLNNAGRAKGTAIYHRSNCKLKTSDHHLNPLYQMSKLSLNCCDIIVVYRSPNSSSECHLNEFLSDVLNFVNVQKKTILCGDFNIDYLRSSFNPFSAYFKASEFKQVIIEPTHILGGLLDHIYTNAEPIQVVIHPVYYSDHDSTCIVIDSLKERHLK